MSQACSLYKAHTCAVIEEHHIAPKSWWQAAKKPVNTPMASICPNCHMDTHWAIDQLVRYGPELPGQATIPPRCLKLARQAFIIAAANGLTPARTL